MRRKIKKRTVNVQPLLLPEQCNEGWSIDFMSDSLQSGRRFRTFNVLDDFNREALAIGVDISLTAQRIVRVLDRLSEQKRVLRYLRCGNGCMNITGFGLMPVLVMYRQNYLMEKIL